jgi:hypothetical protein
LEKWGWKEKKKQEKKKRKSQKVREIRKNYEKNGN